MKSVSIHIQYFFGMARKTLNTKYLLELIKRRSKVQETNMSCECALNFDQAVINERLIPACLQIYRELLSLTTFLRVHSNSKEVPNSPDKLRILT